MASKLKLTELLYPTSTTPAITINADDTVTFGAPTTTITNLSATNLAYTGTLTGGTGVINIGSGQVYKDASGNVGIDTATPAYRLQVRRAGGAGSLGISVDGVGSVNRVAQYFAVGDSTSVTTGHAFYTRNGTATDNLAALIDSSGNVGIGTSSPQAPLNVSYSSTTRTDTLRLTNINTGGYGPWLNFYGDYSGGYSFAKIGAENESTGATLRFHTADTSKVSQERMRIDSSGNLLVGTTGSYGGLTIDNKVGSTNSIVWLNISSTSNVYAQFEYNGGGRIGSISTNGSTVAYNTSSDYRLKENVAPMTSALATVAALKPCTYTWKSTGEAGQGFIAHELQAVVPDCVTGTKDAVDKDGKPQYQGVDTSFLVATVVAALQELKAEFDAYKLSHP